MATKYVYASEPVMFHANGLKVGDRESPSISRLIGPETKKFINDLLKRILVDINPVGYHRCTPFCKQQVHFLLGYPHGCDVRSSVPEDVDEAIDQYERLVENKVYGSNEEVELQSISIRLLPCSKHLEILNVAIYL